MSEVNSGASTSSAMGALDGALLAQYRQRRTGLLERLITAYLGQAPQYLSEIRTGAGTAKFDAVKMAAHALKSSSVNLGAARLSEICQRMEDAALSRDGGRMSGLLEAISVEFFEVEEALKGELMRARHATA